MEHVGSTAVPGVEAKPIIDIAVATTERGIIEDLKQPLADLGYIDRGDGGQDGGYLFVKESSPEFRTHHLHIVEKGDPQWSRYLEFRDTLKASGTIRRQYSELKRTLAMSCSEDRRRYTASKDEFISEVLRREGA